MNGPPSRLTAAVDLLRRRRFAASAESGRATLWPWPTASGVVAGVVGTVVADWQPLVGTGLEELLWPGERDAATTMLQLVPASVMTATSITFSLMVVALQMSSQQFSPRLLRQFTRDRVFKVVLSVLVATFAYSVSVLRVLDDDVLPGVALLLTYLFSLASLAALVAFIAHVARSLRVETMMLAVHADTSRAMKRFYPEAVDGRTEREQCPPSGDSVVLLSDRSGFIRLVDVPALVNHARDAGIVVWLAVRPGDHLIRGTPVAQAASTDPGGKIDEEAVLALLTRALDMGYERTLEQDPSLGFRELTDIAVKALSPALNDPVTADHALGHIGDLLVRMAGLQLGPQVHFDDDGQLRVVTIDRDFQYYLDLPCGQIRRFSSGEPTVLVSVLRMLRNVAPACRNEHQRREIRRQVDLVLGYANRELAAEQMGALEEMAERVEQALAGQLGPAFADRAGETRSM